ncbi:MAG: hypothetical protein ISR90_07025 [Candidatus Marinimicrobia bacterium]|nr:hypothetical protein [Candidatus Neomarinimicrobiota bacterium]
MFRDKGTLADVNKTVPTTNNSISESCFSGYVVLVHINGGISYKLEEDFGG